MGQARAELRPISQLKGWDKNPRQIRNEDFERLVYQIKTLGVYKPLIIDEEGVVIGGNMRLAAFKKLGMNQVWVSVVKAPTDADKLAYALSDNDQTGYYLEQELAELANMAKLADQEQYKLNSKKSVSVEELLQGLSPDEESGGGQEPGLQTVICPHCGQEFEI